MIVANIISSIIALIAICTLWFEIGKSKSQKIDDKFYELLKIHRQNVEEMKIGLLVGRQVFKEMYYELGNCNALISNIFDNKKHEFIRNDENKDQHEFYYNYPYEAKRNLAYNIFFYGYEFNNVNKFIDSDSTILDTENLVLIEAIQQKFIKQNKDWKQGNASITKNSNNLLISYYKPYCGHSEWLGHYFRHLYQTVKFIDKACLCKKSKREYIKTLKAQLSEYEQALLFYHACSDLGKDWFKEDKNSFIIKYRLIQHLPLLMIYKECSDLRDKLQQILSLREIENYFKPE
jgi:hypothetical protein